MLVYVDNLLIGGDDPAGILELKAYLSPSFHMKDLACLKDFLGIEIARHGDLSKPEKR